MRKPYFNPKRMKMAFILARVIMIVSTSFLALCCFPYLCAVLSLPFESIPVMGNAILLGISALAILS